MVDEESINQFFIKDEYPFEQINGIVCVQANERYFIKCSHCEFNFDLIDKFTKHCIENHNSFLYLPTVDYLCENFQDISECKQEISTNINQISEISNDPFISNGPIKKDQNENIKSNQEFITNTEFGNENNNKQIENKETSEINKIEKVEKNKIIITEDLKCNICEKKLMSKSGYIRHMKRQNCSIPAIQEVNNFQCKFCIKVFTKSILLKRHEQLHQRTDILTCKHCKSEFIQKKNFLAHLKTHLVTEKLHKCEICLKDFRTKDKLKCHTLSVHSSEPIYKCNQCSNAYHSSYKLREHKSDFHNGPPKHKCKYCPKTFIRLCDLQVHERVHTGEKPYQCEICGKGFSTVNLLTKHNKRHTNERNFKCDICGKCFFSSTYLRDHMVTHTKIKSFSCEICNTRFTLRTALIKHRKLHSGIKEYICKLCGKAYAQSPGLYAHMKTHKLAQESKIL